MQNDLFPFDPSEELDISVTPTPLSDPVLTAIFQNAEVGGLAMQSFVNATLEDSGDKLIGDVISLTPQSVHSETSARGYRIDVEAKSATGEITLLEVQLSAFASTIERSLLYAEQALASGARRGESLSSVAATMPRVIVVNLLEKSLREHGGFHQVIELSYREPPYERATDKFEVHNLELGKYRKLQEEFTNPLRCWLTAICRSQDSKRLMAEVVKMDPTLQAFYEQNPGFAQFVDRHGVVAAAPEVRKAFRKWEYNIMLDGLEEERRAAKIAESEAKGEARGEAKGKAEGVAAAHFEIALNAMKFKGHKTSQTMLDSELSGFGIPRDIIKAAREQYEREREQRKEQRQNRSRGDTAR